MEVILTQQILVKFCLGILFLFPQIYDSSFASPGDGGFDIRLHNGTQPTEGRVEIYINGKWGSVCASESWDKKRASYFCRLLYYDSAVSVLRDPIFGQGRGPVMIDQLECKNYFQTSFDYCDKIYFPRDCTTPGAAVRCLKRPYNYADLSNSIRLVGGDSPFEGRVEINVNGVWGSICSQGWDIPNGNVICKQMGFGPAINTKSVSYGNGDGPVMLSNVECRGNEKTVLECDHIENMIGHCMGEPSRDDVGIRCTNPSDLYFVRLRSFKGSTSLQGIVEINVKDRWGSICTSTWTEANSRVLCRGLDLGPPEGRADLPPPEDGDEYPYVYAPHVLDSVDCEGSEPHLATCSHSPWRNSTKNPGPGCVAEQIVSITCSKPITNDWSIRLQNSSSSYDGNVEVYYQNQWRPVCSNKWDLNDAVVVCRQIGLGAPVKFYTASLKEDLIYPVVDTVECMGDEMTLRECDHSGFGKQSCENQGIAAVTCSKPKAEPVGLGNIPIRLVSGKDDTEGRVEIYYNSTWGSVCDTNWDTQAGDVVCRQLGYGDALEASRGSHFESVKRRTVKMWLDNIHCTGDEAMLAACSHSQWGITSCDVEQEAGVKCMTGNGGSTTMYETTKVIVLFLITLTTFQNLT